VAAPDFAGKFVENQSIQSVFLDIFFEKSTTNHSSQKKNVFTRAILNQ
jgi:hypothetical protein